MSIKLHVVIVTYNRLEKLQKTLCCYAKQTVKPQEIIVINNHSTDDTETFLENWKHNADNFKKTIITTERNIGGAGGFALGMQQAIEHNADWIWISDDDAYPAHNAIELTTSYCTKFSNEASCICGTVLHQGGIDIDHRRISKGIIIKTPVKVSKEDYTKEYIEIDESTFVGSCFKANVVKDVGLPLKDYFIYFDDTEFCHRIRKLGKIILVPKIEITHDTVTYSQQNNVIATWKDYYLVRNHVNMLKRHQTISHIAYCLKKIYNAFHFFMKHHNITILEMNLSAINDGMNNKLGLHHIYKPGFEVKTKN